MKIYILTCVNEDGDVVFVQPFTTHELAHATMDEQYRAERRDFEEDETLDNDHDFIEESMHLHNPAVMSDYYFSIEPVTIQ